MKLREKFQHLPAAPARSLARLIVSVAWLTYLTASGVAQDTLDLVKKAWVTTEPVAPVHVSSGKPGRVQLDFRVMSGFHINSRHPKDELLQPTLLKLNPPTDILVGKVNYPEGKDLTFAFLPGESLNVYTGDFNITALVTAARSLPAGTYRVHAALKYQACDDRQCYPPREAPADFDVKVEKTGSSRASSADQSPRVQP